MIKVGIIGAGAVTKDLHLPVLANMKELELSWICDIDPKKAKALAALFGIPKTYQDINECTDVNIVLIAIPIGYRKNVMEVAIKRKWHIFCEKPFAATAKEFNEYHLLSKEAKLEVGVGMVRRYAPAVVLAKKIIETDIYGPILEAWANEGNRTKRTGQESNWYMGNPDVVGGGVFMETGSHLVDQLCNVLNAHDYKYGKCYQKVINDLEYETQFSGELLLENQKSIKCTIKVSRLSDLNNGIFLRFSNFILKCGLFFEETIEVLDLSGEIVAKYSAEEGAHTIAQAFYMEWRDYLNQYRNKEASNVHIDTVKLSTEIIDRCYRESEKLK